MEVLYLVFESIKSPIVESQVLEMCKKIDQGTENVRFTIVSIEACLDKLNLMKNYNINFIPVQKQDNVIQSYLEYLKKIKSAIQKFEFDVIHVRSYLPMPIALLFKRFSKIKVIFDMRGLLPEEHIYLNNKSKNSIMYIGLKLSERYFIKKSDQVIVVSHNFKEYLLKRYRNIDDVEIVYCSANDRVVDESHLGSEKEFKDRYDIQDEQIKIAYVGSFYKYQNIDKIFDFVSSLKKQIKIKFLVFTKNERNDVEYLANKYGISKNEIAIDYLPSNMLTNYLRYCDFGVIFRDDNIINKVSSPIKISEYIMNDMKILYTGSIGDFDKILNHYECGIDLTNYESESEAIFEKISTYSNSTKNPDELKRLVSYKYNVEKYEAIYLKLLKKQVILDEQKKK